jgi:hypothetical protein
MFFEVDHQRATTVTAKQPIAHNQVRISLECRCEVAGRDVATAHYALTASCKTEKVAVERDIWMNPNADFCIASSNEEFLIFKRWQQCGIQIERESPEMATHEERQIGNCDDAWTAHNLDLEIVEARELASNDQIVEAVHRNRSLVSRTEFNLVDGRRILLEYPIKTINVSNRAGNYQIDTGPVLFPDLSIGHERFVGNFRLAYIAHNCREWAEFIVNVPTPIEGGPRVHHFSKPVRLDVKNTVLELA